jgi:hypothetical protein
MRRDPQVHEAEKERRRELEARGLSGPLALAVARGELSFNQALTQLAERDRARRLSHQHNLDPGLAVQIARGQEDLQQVLRRRRIQEALGDMDRSTLQSALQSASPLLLGLHGQTLRRGVVQELGRYAFSFRGEEGEERLDKVLLKYAMPLKAEGDFLRLAQREASLWENPREPIRDPAERYRCSSRRLCSLQDQKALVEITLLEGEILLGQVSWTARYQFGLQLQNGPEITVFRHALEKLKRSRAQSTLAR